MNHRPLERSSFLFHSFSRARLIILSATSLLCSNCFQSLWRPCHGFDSSLRRRKFWKVAYSHAVFIWVIALLQENLCAQHWYYFGNKNKLDMKRRRRRVQNKKNVVLLFIYVIKKIQPSSQFYFTGIENIFGCFSLIQRSGIYRLAKTLIIKNYRNKKARVIESNNSIPE